MLTRRDRCVPLLWAAITNMYAACARLWTPNPNRRKEARRG